MRVGFSLGLYLLGFLLSTMYSDMDFNKKRQADENGGAYALHSDLDNKVESVVGNLLPEDAEKMLDPLSKDQLLPILGAAILRHPDILEEVRTVADADLVRRKLFVRGLGWETTTDKLRVVFSAYGELDEANTIVITDKNTGKSKGYGFVTFQHVDAAILALKEPNKKIDGRITVTQLAAAGNSGNSNPVDLALRKVYVGNIPFEISSERLLSHFSSYGEIEEGPLGFDKQSGKAKGFAFFVYKMEEGANASLVDPMKTIDGHQLVCKLATDNKKQMPILGPPGGMTPGMPNSGVMGMHGGGMPTPNYGMGGYTGFRQGQNMPQHSHSQQTGMMNHIASYNTAMGGPGGRGYGGGSQYSGGVGGAGPGEFGVGLGNAGGYRMQPSAIGMHSSGSYLDGGNYGIQATYPLPPNQPGNIPGPRVPAYQGMPPYH